MIIRIIRKIFLTLYSYFDHVGYAKYIGVNMGVDVHIYGNPSGMFSTEPWIITLGNHVHITKDVPFITHDGGTLLFRNLIPDLKIIAPIVVGDNVYIGVRSIIMPGVVIGNNCIIAGGSIVTKNIPDNSVVAGIPAKIIKSTDQYLSGINKRSLHLGHLTGKKKNEALKEYFGYNKIKEKSK